MRSIRCHSATLGAGVPAALRRSGGAQQRRAPFAAGTAARAVKQQAPPLQQDAETGSVLGSALLVAGTAVGAGETQTQGLDSSRNQADSAAAITAQRDQPAHHRSRGWLSKHTSSKTPHCKTPSHHQIVSPNRRHPGPPGSHPGLWLRRVGRRARGRRRLLHRDGAAAGGAVRQLDRRGARGGGQQRQRGVCYDRAEVRGWRLRRALWRSGRGPPCT
jgi:hypothetical protein